MSDAGAAFTVWRHAGTTYLAVELGNRVSVIDECGRNYGAWFDAESFRSRQRRHESIMPVGSARLAVWPRED